MDCQECGFRFDDIVAGAIAERLLGLTLDWVDLLRSASQERLRTRPQPGIWSPLEYACHARDVLLNLRDRVILALVEAGPVFAPMHREERVRLARYADESPESVADGLRIAAGLLGRLFEQRTGEELARTGRYAGVERDVLWIGRQAVHETHHHLLDGRRGLAADPA